MKHLAGWLCAVGFAAAVAACQEQLVTPADCPSLCPGTSLLVKDTVLDAIVGADSSFSGYVGFNGVGALLVSSGIDAGEARTWATFPQRPDSVPVNQVPQPYTIDSVAIHFNLLARDSTVPGIKLFLHRIPGFIDTTVTFAGIDTALTAATLIDSILVPDTLKTGDIRVMVSGDELSRLVPFDGDSGRLGIGVRVHASEPTGVRLQTLATSTTAPQMIWYVHATVQDTASQKQTLSVISDSANYVINGPPPPAPDVLYVGGQAGTRSIIRFVLPKSVTDSASVVRATLELTAAGPLKGVPNDPASLVSRALIADLGAKSPPLASPLGSGLVPAGATGVLSFEVRAIVATWFSTTPPPPTILLEISPEGGTFSRPEFFSTRSPSGAPRLRITYAVPTRPGHP